NAAIRAHSCNSDMIVGCACGDPGHMGAVPETVLGGVAHEGVLTNDLPAQIGVGIVHARVDDRDDNVAATQSYAPSRRRRHSGRPPLVNISIMRAAVCSAEVRIIGYERALHRLDGGVELRELYIRSVTQMMEEREP